MFAIGTRVRSFKSERLTGEVVGVAAFLNPWTKVYSQAYLVKLDEAVQTGRDIPAYTSVSILVMEDKWVERIPEVIEEPPSLVDAIQHSRRSGDPRPLVSVPEAARTGPPEGRTSGRPYGRF